MLSTATSTVGRLSGPALYKIPKWRFRSNDTTSNGTTSMVGEYRVTLPGCYFVEILVLYCQDWFHALAESYDEHTGDFHNTGWKNSPIEAFQFEKICLLDEQHWEITAADASIEVLNVVPVTTTNPTANNPHTKFSGYWWNNNSKRINSRFDPLFTRRQPMNCRHGEFSEASKQYCWMRTRLERYDPYQFRLVSSKDGQDVAFEDLVQPRRFNVCQIGKSHSGRLVQQAIHSGLERYANITVKVFPTKYPNDVEHTLPKLETEACDAIVVAVGQWPVGYDGHRATIVGSFYTQMHQAMAMLQQHENTKDTPLYARSINYNPMGDNKVRCPPQDWRSPNVIEAYNAVIQQVCAERGIAFVDSSFIVGPMWDAAMDWYHLDGPRIEAQLLWLLAEILMGDYYNA